MILTDEEINAIAIRVAEILDEKKTTPEYMTVKEASEYLNCCIKTIHNQIENKSFRTITDGVTKVYKEDLDAYRKFSHKIATKLTI